MSYPHSKMAENIIQAIWPFSLLGKLINEDITFIFIRI